MRNFDGRFPFKTGTPPLTGLGSKDDGNRKNENHSAPPVLGDQQRASLMNPLRVVDLSSTQALINMMRSASAHSASHLENYLRGTLKRPFGLEAENRADPLDLTVSSANKKLRTTAMDRASLLDPPPPSSSSSALNARFSGVGSAKSMRDFHDLFGSFKSDSEGSDVGSDAAPSPKSIHSTSRLWSSASSSSVLHETLKQPHSPPNGESSSSPSPNKNNNNNNGPNSDNGLQQHPCLSTCGDRACADNAEAGTIAKWTVDDVCKFVAAIDTCAEYAEVRSHDIPFFFHSLLRARAVVEFLFKLETAFEFHYYSSNFSF